MVRDFKGQVKVSDIKAEFDNLVDGINNMVDHYNSAANIEEIDYSKGGTDIAPDGYTLTIGALKKILTLYDGTVYGCKVFQTTSGNYAVSNGLIFTTTGIIHIPQTNISGSGDIIYYDKANECYVWGSINRTTGAITYTSTKANTTVEEANLIFVSKVNTNRYASLTNAVNAYAEQIPEFTIGSTSSALGLGGSQELDTTKGGQFMSGMEFYAEPGRTATLYLFNQLIAYNSRTTNKSQRMYWTNVNRLFIPKGLANPYAAAPAMFRVFDTVVKRGAFRSE